VGFIGVTGLPLKIFQVVLERTEVDTILSYCRYALNDTSLAGLIPTLQEKKIGIISASPLGMGLLTHRGAPDWHPASNQIQNVCALASAYCHRQGVDIAKLAMQFALANPDIQTTLVGTANPDNIHKNVAWLEEPLDEKLLGEVQKILQPVQNQTWIVGRTENN
jgi:aryl-alcohol dehydrogenase-like predicted oxidoreductase